MRDKTKNIIGLSLCLIGIVILIHVFEWMKILILIPIVLFVISYFINNRTWSITLNVLTLLPLLIVYLGLRIPVSKGIIVDSRIKYQMIDFGQGDFIRHGIEHKLNNQRVFLADTINGVRWVYVSKEDFKKLWPESPYEMRKKNYTIKARFKIYRLLTGDYSKARLINFDKVEGNPLIRK